VKTFLLVLGIAWLGLGTALGANPAAVDEILKLKSAGVNEETVVAFIKSKNLAYGLSSDDLISLRDKGLTPAILNAMLGSGGSPAATTQPTSAQNAPRAPITYPGQPVATPPPPAPSVQPAVPAAPTVAAAPTVPIVAPPLSGDATHYAPELNAYGRWILGDDGQWYWQPSVVLSSPGWRPYWDAGHWVNTDQGWYWASDYPWGGITFHYGRWSLHPRHGWVWLPDRVWGPSWVVWRTGGEYCGWAPLPPGVVFNVNAGVFFHHGHAVATGFDFGLDWHHYNFSLVSDMGSRPVLRLRTEVEIQGVFRSSVVLHGYTSVRSGGTVRIVNRGVEPGRVAAIRGHPVETVRIHDTRSVEPGRSRERVDSRKGRIDVYRH
jgi:hypothetical protein